MNVLAKYLENDNFDDMDDLSIEETIDEFEEIEGSLEEISASIESMTLLSKVGEVSQEAFQVSLEHYGMPANVTMEGVKDGLKKAWEAIVAMFKKFWAWVTGNSKKVTAAVEQNVKAIEKETKEAPKLYKKAEEVAKKVETDKGEGTPIQKAEKVVDEELTGDKLDQALIDEVIRLGMVDLEPKAKVADLTPTKQEEVKKVVKRKLVTTAVLLSNKRLFGDVPLGNNLKARTFLLWLDKDHTKTIEKQLKTSTEVLSLMTAEVAKINPKDYKENYVKVKEELANNTLDIVSKYLPVIQEMANNNRKKGKGINTKPLEDSEGSYGNRMNIIGQFNQNVRIGMTTLKPLTDKGLDATSKFDETIETLEKKSGSSDHEGLYQVKSVLKSGLPLERGESALIFEGSFLRSVLGDVKDAVALQVELLKITQQAKSEYQKLKSVKGKGRFGK